MPVVKNGVMRRLLAGPFFQRLLQPYVASVTAMFASLSRAEDRVLGRPAGIALTDGNAGGNFTYVLADAVDRAGPVTLSLFARATGTMKVARITRNGNAATVVQSVDVPIAAAGEQAHVVTGMTAAPGEFLGYYGVGIWASTPGVADGAGRYYLTTAGAPASGPISAAPETAAVHQVRLTVTGRIQTVTSEALLSVANDVSGIKAVSGSLDTPLLSGRSSAVLVDASGKPISETTPALIDHADIWTMKAQIAALKARRFNAAPFKADEGRSALSHPSHLSRWNKALALAEFKRVTMMICGNSLPQGQRSDDGASGNDATYRKRGFVGQMRNQFGSMFYETGEGIILTSDPRVVKVGTLGIPSIGITASGQGQRIRGAGQYVEITIDDANELWTHILWETASNNAPLAYQINGGSVVQAAYPALTDGASYAYKLRGLSSGTNVIRILPNTADAAKQINIEGFSSWNDTRDRGVALHRLAIGGGRLSDQFYPSSNAANPRADWITLGQFAPSLIAFSFGQNELSAAGQALGHTPDTYYTLLKDKVTYCTDVLGCSVLLISLTRFNPSQVGSNYTEEQFYQVHERIALENRHVAHFDLSRIARWKSYETARRHNLMFDDIHPFLRGHTDISRLIFDAITFGAKR